MKRMVPNLPQREPSNQLEIQWKPVLQHLLQMLGGTEPVFRTEEPEDMMFHTTVSFRLYLNNIESTFEDIVVTSSKCFAVDEAESEAVFSALQKLEGRRRLGIRIMDISRLRCEESEKKCYRFLVKAEELCNAVKITLSSWEANMGIIDACCEKLNEKAVQQFYHRENEIHGEIILDAADRLCRAKKTNDSKFGDLVAESEEMKKVLADVKDRVNSYFFTPLIDMIDRQKSVLPTNINLSMKIILHQMMNSLGWPEPYFTVMHKGRDVYVCDIDLSPDHNYIEEEGSKITIAGAAASCEADAVESSCKDAILVLESCYRIRLVDVNYNSRSHAERCVAEAQDVLQSAHYIGNKILGEWEMMVDGIHKFQQHCTDLAVKHTGTKLDDEVYNVKRECAVYADQLCKTCLADLHLAKRRFVNAGTWTDV